MAFTFRGFIWFLYFAFAYFNFRLIVWNVGSGPLGRPDAVSLETNAQMNCCSQLVKCALISCSHNAVAFHFSFFFCLLHITVCSHDRVDTHRFTSYRNRILIKWKSSFTARIEAKKRARCERKLQWINFEWRTVLSERMQFRAKSFEHKSR